MPEIKSLTPDQVACLCKHLDKIRHGSPRDACDRNQRIFCFINTLNALGFITADEYHMLDAARTGALLKYSTTEGAILQSYAEKGEKNGKR